MHPFEKKALCVTCLTSLWLLVACERPAENEAEMPALAGLPEAEITTEPGCGTTGHLSTELYGSIAKQINWAAEDLHCESMMRPNGQGVRLRFKGNAAGSQLAIILAMPELRRGMTAKESPTVVTLTVEGSGRFFSTPTSESCWSDITSQDPVDQGSDQFVVSGTLYCVAPLGEINGDAAISIPKLEFIGIIDWNTT